MPRNRRLNMTLNEEEYSLFISVKPSDMSLAATVRRLAIRQATWLAERGKKQEPIVPTEPGIQVTYTPDTTPERVEAARRLIGLPSDVTPRTNMQMGEFTLDTSESQIG